MNLILKLKQLLCFHEWSLYQGYEGKPHHTAHCINCKKLAEKYL